MNLCCKFVAGVYTPSVRRIPISKDEQFCMREAQFHSAAPQTSAPSPSQTSANQHLDPGAPSSSKPMPARKTSKSAASSNSLLKQAIANRISGETSVEAAKQPSEHASESTSSEPAKIHKTDSNEMSKSVLLNPAWYRDEQGRTGYKTSDWENVSNKQKDVVKQKKNKKTPTTDGIKELDNDLLSDNASASGSMTSNTSECSDPKKLAIEQKKREKELKKQEEKAKKEEKKRLKKKTKEGPEIVETAEVETHQPEKAKEKTAATIKLTLTSKKTPTSIRKLKADSSSDPKKTSIGERRDSSMSIASKVSFKSVTFNDRVETREIERNSFTSSEDDAAIMSDDELAKPSFARRKKIPTMRAAVAAAQKEEQNDFYEDDDLDDFEEQERLALLGNLPQYVMNQQYVNEVGDDEEEEEVEYPEEDTLSQNSYYAEDQEGADIYLRNEQSFIEMQITPAEVAAVGSDVIYERNMMGSMSKLHGDDSSASLLFGYQLPRSASGYFEAPAMNYSYEEAIRGPGVHLVPPNQLKMTTTQRSVYENVESPVSLPPTSYYQMPPQQFVQQNVSSPSRSQLARQQFFNTSTTQTPSNMASRTIETSSQSSSTSTIKQEVEGEESEMRKRFVARFGPRKAPIAHKEEDPADPVHAMGSQESMISTDSRESVVSAASVRAEATARRNFNY